ncbi:MAG: hypothetical protein LBH79_02285 [Nitrososphaerota archaeon]|jgi:hypothetical protein|nr:hypothetical protein [Nitrososphaerota archaeon]
MSVKLNSGSRRKTLIVVSLVIVAVIVGSLLAYRFLVVDNDGTVRVKNASELRDAVNKAEVGVPVNIALTNDISLGAALAIPPGADITLKSTGGNDFFKLIGFNGQNVITVENGGRLTLDGIIVTHEEGSTGLGIGIFYGGTLIMANGEISGNLDGRGGGVGIDEGGVFELYGGKISGNTATWGGGVYNRGVFKMSGGEISDNTAKPAYGYVYSGGYGGGVYLQYGFFTMSGGKISGNTALQGGGLYGNSTFVERLGGEIFGNTADIGDDVYDAP